MKNENKISLSISSANKTAINDAITALAALFEPMLVALDPDDRRTLAKMNDRSIPFVEKVVQYVDSNPEFVPTYGGCKKDCVNGFNQHLFLMEKRLCQLHRRF